MTPSRTRSPASRAAQRWSPLLAGLRGRPFWAQFGGSVAALIVLSAGFQLISGSFLTLGNLRSVVEAAAVPAIIAAGISFVVIMGAIDLSVEGVMATASMVAALLVANGVNTNHLGVLGILLALAVSLAFGLANGILNALMRMPSLIVTLGMWFIGLGTAAVLFPQRVPQIRDDLLLGVARHGLLGFSLVVYVALVFVASAQAVLSHTTFGRMVYAIGGDEALLASSGLRTRGIKIAAFCVSSLFAGVGGLLLSAQLGSGNANIGNGHLFPAISASVLGGTLLTGGRGGAVQSALGALILEVLNNGLIQIGAGPYTRNIISGAVILTAFAASGVHRRQLLRVVK
ncbi:ABC transporter permease [Rhizosaccharibacter radicis]|uniref:ABC transporter permease n=1 Tax=Rhizosaccharibacter radicis TaxID=2782605 RepID=A0ABT1W2J9_9PROT|nr:ABC transporter permease [Acetobacteraceae bacterium KSS12]